MKQFIQILILVFVFPLHAQQSDFSDVDFWRAEYIAKGYEGESLHNLPIMAHGITSSLSTDVERFRAVYYWICHNIKGDYHLTTLNDEIRARLKDDPEALEQWNDQFQKEMFATLLTEKKTLCTGYAYLIKRFANLVGLECEIIYGYGQTVKAKLDKLDTPNHSWNAVKLNGKWYLCDATWSSGIIDSSNYSFEFRYNDTFFLMEPLEFGKSHLPVDVKWLLEENPFP